MCHIWKCYFINSPDIKVTINAAKKKKSHIISSVNVMPWWWYVTPYLVLTLWSLENFKKFNRILFWGLLEPQRDLYTGVTFRLSRGCALGWNWLRPQRWMASMAILPEGKGKGNSPDIKVTKESNGHTRSIYFEINVKQYNRQSQLCVINNFRCHTVDSDANPILT